MKQLPENLAQAIVHQINTDIVDLRSISGGDINQAARMQLANGQVYFVKWHRTPQPGMFAAEATGLRYLAQAQSVSVPDVVLSHAQGLVMTWLGAGNPKTARAATVLGTQLARQHRFTSEAYGLAEANYCGLTPQPNTPADHWPTFFAEQRLGHQLHLAERRQRLPAHRRQRLERLISRLTDWLPPTPPASLLHGDLWGGNWLVADDGQPALIDPAVYFGHREVDLAFTEVFGGFPPGFYDAYQAAWPLEPGYPERKHIYNLYHILNHLNLFGEPYGNSVDRILDRFD